MSFRIAPIMPRRNTKSNTSAAASASGGDTEIELQQQPAVEQFAAVDSKVSPELDTVHYQQAAAGPGAAVTVTVQCHAYRDTSLRAAAAGTGLGIEVAAGAAAAITKSVENHSSPYAEQLSITPFELSSTKPSTVTDNRSIKHPSLHDAVDRTGTQQGSRFNLSEMLGWTQNVVVEPSNPALDPEAHAHVHAELRSNASKHAAQERAEVYVMIVSMVVVWVLFATLLYYAEAGGMSMFDTVYSLGVMLSYTGYGDVVPKTDLGKLILIPAMFTGVGLMIALNWRFTLVYMDRLRDKKLRFVCSASIVMVLTIGSGFVIAALEDDINVLDGIYFAASSLAAVGYGDIVPQSVAGRVITFSVLGMLMMPAFTSASFALVDLVRSDIVQGPLIKYCGLQDAVDEILFHLNVPPSHIHESGHTKAYGTIGATAPESPDNDTLNAHSHSRSQSRSHTATAEAEAGGGAAGAGGTEAGADTRTEEHTVVVADVVAPELHLEPSELKRVPLIPIIKLGIAFVGTIGALVMLFTVMFMLLENEKYDFFQAYWYTISTMACVGYGESVHGTNYFPETDLAKIVFICFSPICIGFQVLCMSLFIQFLTTQRITKRGAIIMCAAGPLALFAMALTMIVPVEGWSFVDGLYFTPATQSTIGYGDVVPKTMAGRIITSFFYFGEFIWFFSILTTATMYAKWITPKLQRVFGCRNDSYTYSEPVEKYTIS
jgi:voltage-gated potassium channel Kch